MVVPPSFPSSHCPLVCPLALRPHAAGLAVPCQAALRAEVHPSSVCRLARLLPVAAGGLGSRPPPLPAAGSPFSFFPPSPPPPPSAPPTTSPSPPPPPPPSL